MLFLDQVYIARGPWHIWDFCDIFLSNINKDQKSPTIWGQGPGTEPYGTYDAGYCIAFIKSLDEGLR